MKRLVTKTVLALAVASPLFSQTPDPISFFPYATGNTWEYYWIEGSTVVDTLQSFMLQDSVGVDTKIYATRDSRFINPIIPVTVWPRQYVVDTVLQQVWGDLGFGFGLLYKLTAQEGDQWVMVDHGGSQYEMCRVVSVRQATVLGMPTIIKDYRYYYAPDSTDTLGLSREGHTLASGLGLIYMGGGDLFYNIYVKGAVIDGILYGDTTYIVTSVSEVSTSLPTQLELLPDYPNPFNPSTTIKFNLRVSGRVTLIVFDALGREIRRLIDDESFGPGNKEVMWNGGTDIAREASSGVYYYRLLCNGNSITRSMMLVR